MKPVRIPLLTALAAALVFSSLAASAGSARTAFVSGTQPSVARAARASNAVDVATALAVSPAGTRVFVTGYSNSKTRTDYATLAYDAASGKRLWLARYNGPGNRGDSASALALSRDGKRLFVTGKSFGAGTSYDHATLAYDASSGKRLWLARYDGLKHRWGAQPSALALSPDGRRLFVTGSSWGIHDTDYATVAYNAATGKRLWARRYEEGPVPFSDLAEALALSPDGTKVFVTGSHEGEYATIAYKASSGKRLWLARYDGHAQAWDQASALAPSPDGTKVFVTGGSLGANGGGYATLAYDARSGKRLWLARYGAPEGWANSLALSPDGTKVFVTGYSEGKGTRTDYATLAYDAVTGRELWVARYDGPAHRGDAAFSLAVSPEETKLFVTGESMGATGRDYATFAYDAATGEVLWVARYNGPANRGDTANALAVNPDGTRVFVTGRSYGGDTTARDYATLDYDAASGEALWVSRYNGPPFCDVPYVGRLPLAKAKADIRASACSVGKVKRAYSRVKKGRVVSQKPKAGTRLAVRGKVKLVVSRGRKSKQHHARLR